MKQSSGRYKWNYVYNTIIGKHVRKTVAQIAYASFDSYVVCNLHNLPVTSWNNTILSPPTILLK